MKITKFVHSCLLVETPDRVALFDPGIFSTVDVNALNRLDDIVVTHEHADHFDSQLIKKLVEKFPNVRIKTPSSLVTKLQSEGIKPTTEAVEGIEIFQAPHEGHPPFIQPPETIGIHYLGKLTHPGDSHSFAETKEILALPITAPWGSTDKAVQLALSLSPKYILPIHDWHWKDEVREEMYNRLEGIFKNAGLTFYKLKNGQPVEIDT